MNNIAKFAIAAAAVVVVAVVGINLLPGGRSVGSISTPSPTASPSPTSTATPSRAPAMIEFPGFSNNVAAGTYAWTMPGLATIAFTLPDGWISRFGIPHKDRDGPGEMAFGNWIIANVYTDPCQWQGSLLDPPVGPTVDDLATAVVAQKGRTASPATDETLGGFPAKRVELTLPADLDIAKCHSGFVRFWVAPGDDVDNWPPAGDSEVRSPRAGQINVVYIIDVNGQRLVIDTWHMPGTSAADLAELDAVLASLRIES